ncbi:MAG: TRAP transporter permease [Geminicoccaceae bacterium]
MAGKEQGAPLSEEKLQELAASDTGGRHPSGAAAKILLAAALLWSLFQLWFASPLPFMLGFGVFNDTEARSIHLAFAVFLAFLAYPALSSSPRDHIPLQDWVLAIVGSFAAAYLYLFYEGISQRPGAPITQDVIIAVIGMVLLLEATRRTLGPPLMIVAIVFLAYTFLGQYMPTIIAHKGNSLNEVVNHHWITTEGVFGIALGVSTKFVFLFVLFGALLDKAGAGNYFIKVAFSLLGHLRGGPAKAAVVASGMTGLISGSSIANVVTTGTFTIPMMKRVGFSAEKGGAVEVASSVNGQIMPPVMGAAAFLMVEYVGISYFDVIKHAFLPALISYIALVYIVHLEALKANMEALPKPGADRPILNRLIGFLTGFLLMAAMAFLVYYGIGWIKPAFGDAALWVIVGLLGAVYLALVAYGSRYPPLEMDDPNSDIVELPETGPTVKTGLHFLLPVVVLVWCLMIERLSPGLSAFYATVLMIFIQITQRPLFAMFRGVGDIGAEIKGGFDDLIQGLIAGAQNMVGIGIATATAGIIVGVVSQTGVGSALANVVEVLSQGNILLILLLTAILSLILGMGLPTTANYIVVSSLLAPVIVTLGQENGLIVPLIAVHLFVFYFGIMADVTPPVGLASFAAAAVSGVDPIKTGFQAFFYSLRTAALPFLFIFNTDLLLIDVGWIKGISVFVIATIAMLVFAAATQGFFFARNRIYETLLLLLVAFSLFRPGFWMDMVQPPYEQRAGAEFVSALGDAETGEELRVNVMGVDAIGEPKPMTLLMPVPEGGSGEERLEAAGLALVERDGDLVVDNAAFDSIGEKAGFDWDQVIETVQVPQDQLPKELMFIPALLILGFIAWLQTLRAKPANLPQAQAGVA